MNAHTFVLAAFAGLAIAQNPQLAPKPVKPPDDWAQRDLEGKWVCYRRDVEANATDPDRKQTWAQLLGSRREYELLEWIGIYEGWRFAGPTLLAAGAPQAFRTALWNIGAYDSHNKDSAKKALLGSGGTALGWFEANPLAQGGKAAEVYQQLRNSGVPAADPAGQLPPLDPIQVLLPEFDAPARLVDFGDRLRAEPKVRYLHQVLRALDGVLIWGDVDEMHAHKILALTRHAEVAVRNAAFKTLTKLPGELLPWEPLLRAADGPGDPAARRLAAMALSFSSHPRAFFELHRIVADSEHPAAETVLARLADIGDHYTLQHLRELAAARGPRQAQFSEAAAKIEKRLAGEDLANTPLQLRVYLERVAWLRAVRDPRADAVAAVTTAVLRRQLAGDSFAALLAVPKNPQKRSAFRGDEAATVAAAMNVYLQELRSAVGKGGR